MRRPRPPARHRRRARASARARAIKLSGSMLAVTLVPAAAAQAQQTITVTTLNDSGTGSLRDAVTTAVGDHTTPTTLDTITFASQLSGSINLLTPLPTITDSIDLQGPGARVITLDASQNHGGTVITDQGQGSALTISGLSMNHATSLSLERGGFLHADSSTAVTLTGDSFSYDNAGWGAGGGAVYDNGSQLTVTGSTFSHDNASNPYFGSYGGAIYAKSPFTMSDSTIYDNSAYRAGGGLELLGSATITGSTIDDNSATGYVGYGGYGLGGGGGGIDTHSPLTLHDSIVAGNTSGVPANADISDGNPGSFLASFSLIQTDPSTLTVDSSDLTGVSPGLGPLANNGGQTDTQLPASASPVIDQGQAFGLIADQPGLARTVIYPGTTAPAGGDHTDIGATELQAVTVTGVSPAGGVAGDTVQITGSGFTTATAVKFAGTPAASFTVVDDGHITATVPAGSGMEDVRVTTPNGQSAIATSDQFSYLPAVTGLSPASGASGDTVQITGSGFTTATAVKFAGTPAASFTVVDDGHITATVPAGSSVEDVRVTTPDGQSAIATSDQFSYLPAVTGVSPASGVAGDTVQITGSGFTAATAVKFAGTPAASFTVTDDGHITATVPAGSSVEDVRVTTPDGQSAVVTGDQFSYLPAVTGVSPASGASGASVQITGSGFTAATAVKFAGTPVASFKVVDDGHITATVPAGSGMEDVRVSTPDGHSAVVAGDQFTYLPAVTGVSPSSGAAGDTVQITGSGFTGANAVKFAGTPATSFTVTDDGHITATVPAGSGVADVRVTTANGQSAVVTGDQFSYLPAVTGVSPATGAPGTSVQITGSGFTAANAVKFAGTPATSFTVTDDGHITATVPAGSGVADVRVTTPDGQSAVATSDQFTYLPAVTGVSPATGASGDTVQITGSDFTAATAVKFAGTPATSFTVTDDGHITATVPAGSGVEDVRVSTPEGESDVVTSDQFTYSQTTTTSTTTPTTSTTSTTTTPTTTTSTTTPTTSTAPTTLTPPVQPRITGVSASATTIVWCEGAGCHYPATRLQFSLNRATTVRLVLRTRPHGHYKPIATTLLHGHQGNNQDRIAGRWHGHLVPVGPVQILVQIQHDHHWRTAKTIGLTVRHTRRQG